MTRQTGLYQHSSAEIRILRLERAALCGGAETLVEINQRREKKEVYHFLSPSSPAYAIKMSASLLDHLSQTVG